jgi:hypothetical protein
MGGDDSLLASQKANPGYNDNKRHFTEVLLSILLVPKVMGDASLPMILTQDDVVWVPQAGKRLEEVRVHHVAAPWLVHACMSLKPHAHTTL